MSKFILKRLGYMLLVLFAVVSITFFLVHSIPGDPITSMVQDLPEETRDAYLARYGFDQPIGVQYVRFLKQLLTGDLGSSLRYPGRKVVDIVKNYAPVSGAVGGIAPQAYGAHGVFGRRYHGGVRGPKAGKDP